MKVKVLTISFTWLPIITHELYNDPILANIKLFVYDYIALAIQLGIEEIKDVYEDIPL
jgi:hypothetical protein